MPTFCCSCQDLTINKFPVLIQKSYANACHMYNLEGNWLGKTRSWNCQNFFNWENEDLHGKNGINLHQ